MIWFRIFLLIEFLFDVVVIVENVYLRITDVQRYTLRVF